MERKFYLLKDGFKGEVLNIPTSNGLIRSFTDIAYLDKATLSIKKEESIELLRKANPGIKLDNELLYIIPDKQIKNKLSVYSPIFRMSNTTGYFSDMLEYYANKRIQNIEETGKVGKFDFREDPNLRELIRAVLTKISQLDYIQFDSLTSSLSIMPGNIKKGLFDSNTTEDLTNPIKRKVYELGPALNNYTSLRNFVYSYILVSENYNVLLNSKLKEAALNKNNIDNDIILNTNCTQFQLSDFTKEIPKINRKRK